MENPGQGTSLRPAPDGRENTRSRGDGLERRRGPPSRRADDAGTQLALWQWTLECLADAVLCLDSEGRLCDRSPACDGLLASCDYLAVRDGRLIATGSRDNAQRLQRALREVNDDTPRRVALLTAKGRLAMRLTVIRVPPHVRYSKSGRSITRVVLVNVPVRQPDMVADYARDYYELTHAETRVLKGLLSGRAPKDIAADLHVGITTVRSHLSRIFQKTHTTNQRELLARLVT
jgi:DNA-binding CsgD family transcriptional regulator